MAGSTLIAAARRRPGYGVRCVSRRHRGGTATTEGALRRSSVGGVTGTLINVAAILVGAGVGVALGGRLADRVRGTITDVLGLFVVVLGLSDALTTFGPHLAETLGRVSVLVILGSLLIGGTLGELVDLEARLAAVGMWLRHRVLPGAVPAEPEPSGPDRDAFEDPLRSHDPGHRFAEGFVVMTLVVCVGPLAILGALQDGLTGDYQLLAVKSVLDGSIAVAFASVLGVGVAFAVLPLLLWQGGIAVAAGSLDGIVSEAMMAGLTAVGGVLVVGIGLRLLEVRSVRVANLLPSLLIAPAVIWLWELA